MKIPGKSRLPLLALTSLLICFGVWWVFGTQKMPAPQIITLPDGAKYEFVGATYSRRCVPPTLAAQFASWLPLRLANWFEKYSHAQISQWNRGQKFDSPHLALWFRTVGTNSTFTTCGLKLADQAGAEGGVMTYATFFRGVSWSCAEFPVFPRRSRLITCDFYPLTSAPYPAPVVTLTIQNPDYKHFPAWQPEPIPATKRDGDLDVRLWEFRTSFYGSIGYGARSNGIYGPHYEAVRKGQDAATWFGVTPLSPRGTNEYWVVHRSELSDATGNVLGGSGEYFSAPQWQPPLMETVRSLVGGTLWPGESAWRLKLQLKRAVGYDSDEVVTFTNVPVPPLGTTNAMPITQTVNGIRVAIVEFANGSMPIGIIFGKMSEANRIRVEVRGKPEGVALDFLSMTTDAGKPETAGLSAEKGYFVQYFNSIPANAHTATISVLVQKTRTVEFLVKPPGP